MSKYKSKSKNKEHGKNMTMLHNKIGDQFKDKGTSETLIGILYSFSLDKLKNLNQYG